MDNWIIGQLENGHLYKQSFGTIQTIAHCRLLLIYTTDNTRKFIPYPLPLIEVTSILVQNARNSSV